MRPALPLAAVALLLAATGAATAPARAERTCSLKPGKQYLGDTYVVIPDAPGPRPLLVAFHYLTGTGYAMASLTDLPASARAHGYVAAFPNAARGRRWDLNRRDGRRDVDRTRTLIDALVAAGCADPAHVAFTGFSNGSGFAAYAACALGSRIEAAMPVAGSYKVVDPCPRARHRVPLLEVHGTRDPFLVSVPKLMRSWTRRNRCRSQPVRTHPRRGVTRFRWPGCGVERVLLDGVAHYWPIGTPADFDATPEIYRFWSAVTARRSRHPG